MNLTDEYIVGFIEAEGHFGAYMKPGYKTNNFRFSICQHKRDYSLLVHMMEYLDIGYMNKYKDIWRLHISSGSELDKLVDFIDKTSGLKGYKGRQYKHWCSVREGV